MKLGKKQGFSPGNLLQLNGQGCRTYSKAAGSLYFVVRHPVLLIKKSYEDDLGNSWEVLVNRDGEISTETWLMFPELWEKIS